jgi:plastocyanin
MKFIAKTAMAVAFASACVAYAPLASAADSTTLEVSIKDNKFQPAEVKAKAGNEIVFKVKNLGTAPIEFESELLQVEQVIKPNAEGTVKVKPQKPGSYVFFDDLHQDTKGTLVVE